MQQEEGRKIWPIELKSTDLVNISWHIFYTTKFFLSTQNAGIEKQKTMCKDVV
jgi:hypothetical protein